jgi:hypothetical protein
LAGFVLTIAAAQAGPAQSVQEVARQAWPYLAPEQRHLVDVVAADLFATATTPTQRRRMTGAADGEFHRLPDWRKAAFRGAALKQLGHGEAEFARNAI